jgi:hypothetical protein
MLSVSYQRKAAMSYNVLLRPSAYKPYIYRYKEHIKEHFFRIFSLENMETPYSPACTVCTTLSLSQRSFFNKNGKSKMKGSHNLSPGLRVC